SVPAENACSTQSDNLQTKDMEGYNGASSVLKLDNDDLIGDTAGVETDCAQLSGLSATTTVDDSIIRGSAALFTHTVSGDTASVTPAYDDFNPADVVGAITGSDPGQTDADPAFVAAATGDYALAWNSGCIDHGTTAALGASDSQVDRAGNPRVVHGRRDIGAYEYQRQAASAAISPTSKTVDVGVPVVFDASQSSDPDPGETAELTYKWSIDGGSAKAGTTTFQTVFTTAGAHTVTVTTTDPVGLTDTATSHITVNASSTG